MMKKLIALILAISFTFSVIILPAYSEENSSGTCGDNVTWTLDSNGTLTISGTGAMTDWDGYSSTPWERDNIKIAIIEEGVTRIGNEAFNSCYNLESLTIPKSITEIGDRAFYKTGIYDNGVVNDIYYNGSQEDWDKIIIGNENELDVTIHFNSASTVTPLPTSTPTIFESGTCGDNVTWILDNGTLTISGTGDMWDWDYETDIPWYGKEYQTAIIEEGVTSICNDAFLHCDSLTNIQIPSSVMSIGSFSIYKCGLKDIYYKGTQEDWNKIIIDDTNELERVTIHFAPSVTPIPTQLPTSGTDGGISWSVRGETLTITGGQMPDYIDIQAPWSGHRDKIKNIIITYGVQNIGAWAFSAMRNVTNVSIAGSVRSIGAGAFGECASLKNIMLPQSLIGIGERAFGYSGLTKITVPSSVTTINSGAFANTPLTEMTLPFIGSQVGTSNTSDTFSYIFDGNVPATLKTVVITNETNVPENAFKDISNIEYITINSGIKTIGNGAFDGCTALRRFAVPNGITEIGDNTFRGCENAVKISVPDTVNAIGEAAFDGCKKLDEVNIPSSVTVINDYTFRNCSSLYSLSIPNGVTSIGEDALRGCTMLHILNIPFVGANANPGIVEITNEGVLGYLFGRSENGIAQGNYKYDIPASLTKVEVTGTSRNGYIPPGAFMNCGNIVDILIDGGRNICKSAFTNCRLLKNLQLPQSIDSIGSGILEGCTRLETLTVPFIGTDRNNNNAETSVLGYFFGWSDDFVYNTDVRQYYDKDKYHIYHIPDTLKNISVLAQTDIPYGAFMNCYSIEQIAIVTGAVIHDRAFYNCSELKRLSLPRDLKNIGYEAFAECINLETVNLPDGTKTIGSHAFYNDRNLREIAIPSSVTEIAADIFNGTELFFESKVDLFAANVNIICASGSKAEEFALENGVNHTIVDENELAIKETSTNVDLLSDYSYLFNVTDPHKLDGNLHVEVYDKDENLISYRTQKAGEINYRIIFSSDEILNASYALIYIEDGSGEMITTSAEMLSAENGDIPQIPKDDFNISYNDGKVTITGAIWPKRGTTLIKAIYDENGVLKNPKQYNVPGLDIPIDIENDSEQTDLIKFMLWESMESMKPIADAIDG